MHIHSAHALATAAALLFAVATADAQVDLTVGKTRPKNPAVSRAPGPRSEPTKTGTLENYSGLSGPGQPVEGTGYGGYRSGNEGLMYRGPEPKEGWLDFGNRGRGTAVANGLLAATPPNLGPTSSRHRYKYGRQRQLFHDRLVRRQYLGH